MSLWYHNGARWLEAQIDGCMEGAKVFLCCPGPSLASVDAAALRGPGRSVVALNKAFPRVLPDMWIGMDPPSCFNRSLWQQPFMKIARWDWRNERCLGTPIAHYPLTFFAELDDDSHPNQMLRRLSGKAKFCWDCNSLMGAVHVLLWLGVKCIFLVGADFGGNKDYYDDTVLTEDQRSENRYLYTKQIVQVETLLHESRHKGILIISCTENSPVNAVIPYVPLSDALKACAHAEPQDDAAPLLHVREAECCLWPVAPSKGRGVIVACDSAQEWLLRWWWDHYRRCNSYPVTFADLGMSEEGRRFCKERGRLLEVKMPRGRMTPDYWYLKPFAIMRGAYEQSLWVDLDCECLGDLAPFFDYSDTGHLGIQAPMKDQQETMMPGETTHYNTGVIAVRHEEPAITSWAERMFSWKRAGGYTDEHPMGYILSSVFPSRVKTFEDGMVTIASPAPSQEQPDKANTLIRHWLGPHGKRHIQEIIAGKVVEPTMQEPRNRGWQPKLADNDEAMCQWKAEPTIDAGVVVGVVPEQAWMVEWWTENFRKHNPDVPVRYMDFTKIPVPQGVAGWFRKPFAVLHSPFRKTLWLDLDTEVRGSIAHIFGMIRRDSVVACRTDVMCSPEYAAERDEGWYTMFPDAAVRFCGGILGFEHGDPLAVEWARHSVPPCQHSYRGDQEILGMVVHQKGALVVELTAADFGLSRAPTDQDALILHYCGEESKRNLMATVGAARSRGVSSPPQVEMAQPSSSR